MKTTNILLLFSFAAILSSCASLTREHFKENLPNPLEKLVYYASLAGNSHNTQPWIVEIENDTTVHIIADFSRKLHIVDPDSRGLFISLGAFIENFELAAGSLSYKALVEITAKHKNDPNVATIRISKSAVTGYDLNIIEMRRTLRTPFRNDEITAEHLNKLIDTGSKEIFFFNASSTEGKFIADQTLAAYSQQAKDDQAKQELSNWIRFSNSDVKRYRDGLTTAGMGINGIGGFFVRNFYKPEDSMKDGFIETGIEKTKEQTENCGGWIVITQNEDTPQKWIETGRIYQKLNLKCTELMIGFHPMNQLIEEDNFEKSANNKLCLPGVLQFIARIGYVDSYPQAISVRRPVGEILIYNKVK
ncbi:MAG: nitroreductase [Ignavibacteriales bacterium]|jgi:hypothetical protein|nr:MAG: nitroreductase [Ignavibacteriales bacterium]